MDQGQLIGEGLPGRVCDRIGPGDGFGQILHQELILGMQAGNRILEGEADFEGEKLKVDEGATDKDHLYLAQPCDTLADY